MLAALAIVLLTPGPPAAETRPDPRTVRLLHERCTSSLATRDLSLFANGTVRLREGRAGAEEVRLGELGPPELAAYVRRISEIDFSESDTRFDAPGGDWLESCALRWTPPEGAPAELAYARYASGNLELDRLRKVLEELVELARRSSSSSNFPFDYAPEIGDLVERADGVRFEVVGFTSDEKGVELMSTDGLLTIFVGRTEVRTFFPHFVSRPAAP